MARKKIVKEWVPEFKYETIKGTFTDYRGQTRNYTMVAVSIPILGNIYKLEALDDEPYAFGEFKMTGFSKMLSIGVSVPFVRDQDRGISERIAYGKALKNRNHTLYVSQPGMINSKMVKALLEQEAEYFEKDPGLYLVGYNDDKMKYIETGRIAEAEMTESEYNKINNIIINDNYENSDSYKDKIKNIPVKARMLKECEA